MTYKLQEDLNYILERNMYEQQMAISNLAFMLSQHLNDKTDIFLSSNTYKKLSEKLVITAITKWSYENEIKNIFQKK